MKIARTALDNKGNPSTEGAVATKGQVLSAEEWCKQRGLEDDPLLRPSWKQVFTYMDAFAASANRETPQISMDEHLGHVNKFLQEMWATMVDPIDDFGGNVQELCAELLKVAREQREQLANRETGGPAPGVWSVLNGERGRLIDRQISAADFTELERRRLAVLNAYADAHLEEVAPRPEPVASSSPEAATEPLKVAIEAKDAAYAERDRLVCALSKLFPAALERHPDSDTSWENDWRWIVFIDLPTGQATWHIHDSELSMFDHLPRFTGRIWDGHTTPQKYERLAAMKAGTVDVEAAAREIHEAGHPRGQVRDRCLSVAEAEAIMRKHLAPPAKEGM